LYQFLIQIDSHFSKKIRLKTNRNLTMRSKKARIFLIIGLSLFSLACSLCLGSASLQQPLVFFELRLPRTEAAFITGGCLSLAGCLMQLLLVNPLADPYILGLSGGASVGALLAVLFFGTLGASFTGAWLGSLAAMLALLLLAKHHRFHTHTLLLMGVALASLLSALASLIAITLPASTTRPVLFWLAGDLNGATPTAYALPVLLSALVLSLFLARGYNVLARGHQEARALGLPLTAYRLSLFLLSAVLTATAVTIAGCIGFIGLIIPHLTRRLMGNDHTFILPTATLLGGSLLTFADTLTRTLFSPVQLPIGLGMTLLGVPFLLSVLST
jgi:iron complex transport system permease protein